MQKSSFALLALMVAPLSIALACSAGSEDVGDDTSGNGSGSGANGPAGSGGGIPTGSGGGFSTSSQAGTGGFAECFKGSSEATSEKQPADIIIAVDTSGSMDEESAQVQQNLNNFATIITMSGIDVHVVLIADASVCIPAPLGSGSCGGADENLPNYRHVVQTVNSNDALEVILNTYDLWKTSLRSNASKTFVVVSDDNSDMSAGEFTQQILAKDPPTFDGFLFHGIVANADPLDCLGLFTCPSNNACCYQANPFVCESYGAAEGTVYKDLCAQTGGIAGDLCAQEFGPIFQQLADGVILASQLSCEYDIPPPPMGETFNPAQVNVNYTPEGQSTMPIYNVPGGAQDCGPQGGWYYDDPVTPTKIIVCPATCDVLQADQGGGVVDVIFGCDTEVVPR